jgi:antitoxin component YwqK of YwqJK toxin-antitoxin module
MNTSKRLLLFFVALQSFGIIGCKNPNDLTIKEKDYFPGGGLKFLVEYSKSEQKEIVKHFFSNGQMESRHEVRDSQINGIALVYYENGDVKDSLHYKNGVLDGWITSYYLKGKIKLIANYKDGRIHGELFSYYSNGTLESYNRYVNDSLHYEEKYDSLGNFKWTYTLPIVESKRDTLFLGDTAHFYIYHPAPDTLIQYFVEAGATSDKKEPVKLARIGENHEGNSFYHYIPQKTGSFFVVGNIGFIDDKKIKNLYPFEKKITVISKGD